MNSGSQHADLAPRSRELLASVRRRIRRYVWRQGLLAAALCALAGFWLLLGIDYWLETSLGVRRLLLGAGGGATLYTFGRWGLTRLLRRLPDGSLAVLVERRFGQFQDGLLTAVELGDQADRQPEFARAMLAHTAREAETRAAQIDVRQLFDFGPVRRLTAAAAALALPAAALALFLPETLLFGVSRVAGLTDEKWPRRTRLEIDGFSNGELIAARGADLELVVKADATMVVPHTVQIRYSTDDGGAGRKNMDREGALGASEWQVFRLNLPNVSSDYRFDVVGGDDDHLRGLHIRVVDSPAVSELTLACEYPLYMGRAGGSLPVTGSMQLPQGVKATVRGRANKDLVSVELTRLVDNRPGEPRIWRPRAGENPREFGFPLDRLDADAAYAFTLHDADGLTSREPLRLTLTARLDEPPKVDSRRVGVSGDITPQARIPLTGALTDDYGVDVAELEFHVDSAELSRKPLSDRPDGKLEVAIQEAFEVAALGLKPGQTLTLGIDAKDGRVLESGEQPHVTRGERFPFNIVSSEELRQLLAMRELNLRQQFERTIVEVTETRATLANLAIGPAPTAGPAASEENAEKSEPVRDRRESVVQRAIQFSMKNAEETRGIATAFEGILQELTNNRIPDSEAYQTRLREGILQPLNRIGITGFTEFDGRLRALQSKYAAADGEPSRQAALAKVDGLLREMEAVRGAMLKLESFEEALAMLRAILEDQQRISKATKQRKLDDLEGDE